MTTATVGVAMAARFLLCRSAERACELVRVRLLGKREGLATSHRPLRP